MTSATAQISPSVTGEPRRVTVLGATGSIGASTLDLIGREADAYDVVALTAHTNAELLARLAIEHEAELAVVADPGHYETLKSALAGTGIESAAGPEGLRDASSRPADWIMAAISGAAGLRPTFEAVRQGTRLALANKECLVSAGDVFMGAVSATGTQLLPVDSEHSAALQAIDDAATDCIERLVLTASGGPFRSWSRAQLMSAAPQDALKHPTWSMGRRITIDSATLMNKGLELIEAYHLFPVTVEQLGVVVHPQSIVHCLVEYADGSVLAHLGCPDMRTPIAYSLTWPNRMETPTRRLDLAKIGQLTFEAPDEDRFPALRIAREALACGGAAPTILNAADEIAVAAYLDGRIGFLSIPALVEASLEAAVTSIGLARPTTLDDVLAIDEAGRELARSLIPNHS